MSRVPAKTTAALASTADDGIDGYRTSFYDPFLGMQEKPAQSTLSIEYGLEAIEIPSLILLEPQEVPLWRAEDALSDGSRLRVAGLIDSELNTEDFAPWITIPATNQKIGRAIVRGDAYSLRIAISNMQLPEGASLVIYPLDNPSAIVGPFTGAGHPMTALRIAAQATHLKKASNQHLLSRFFGQQTMQFLLICPSRPK
jgi:hypothetical protein